MTVNRTQASDIEQARRDLREPRKELEGAPLLVSVVIPCYNQAHFLGEAIESVLAQSYPNFEIIVVDDGSPDDTAEVAARYPEVRLVRQENQGLSAARNAGLARSEGEYVVFLDADDRLLPEALEVGVGYLNVRPECAFVSGHFRVIAVDGSPLPTREQRYVEKDHYLALLRHYYIGPPVVVMYRRAVFESVGGFDTSVGPAADLDISLRIARRFPVGCYRKVVAEYRQHGTNMSGNPAKMLKASLIVRRSYRKHVKGNKKYEEASKVGIRYIQAYYGGLLNAELRTHLQEREWKQALRGMLILLWYAPLTLLGERHIKRQKLALQLQLRKQELEIHEQRLKELESAQEAESALAEERQEAQELRRRLDRLERRIQDLSLRARLRTRIRQNGKSRRLLEKLGRLRAKKSRRLLKRLGRVRIALLSERRMERRMERRRLTRRLQDRREELKVRERRLKELEGAQEVSESALLAEERQELQQLRRRIRGFERRIQNLSLRTRLRARLRARIGRNGKVWKLLKRLRSNRAGVWRRLRRG